MTEYIYDLPKDGSDVIGLKVGPTKGTWPGRRWFNPEPLIRQGYTKMRIIGHGNNVFGDNGADATVCIDEPRIPVSLEGDMTIHASSKRALLIGEGSAGSSFRPVHCDILSGDKGGVFVKGKPNDAEGAKWAMDSYQHTGTLVGLRIDSELCHGDGHARYGRGSYDLTVIDLSIEAAYKEGWKEAARGNFEMWESEDQWTKHTKWGTPWMKMPRWRFQGGTVKNFALSHKPDDDTYHFGGAFIFQPCGALATFEGVTVDDSADSGTMLFGMNDGTTQDGFESWAYDRPERDHPAGGPVVAIRCTFRAPKRKGNVPRILIQDATTYTEIECTRDLHPDARVVIESPYQIA